MTSKPTLRSSFRRGLTLLETMVSVAILGASLAALGTLIGVGMRSAELAREGTTAQILAESVMSEVTAGSLPAESVGPLAYDEEGAWYYTVEVLQVQSVALPLLEVHVYVEQGLTQGHTPIHYHLVRWMPDPSVELPADAAAVVSEEDPALMMEGF